MKPALVGFLTAGYNIRNGVGRALWSGPGCGLVGGWVFYFFMKPGTSRGGPSPVLGPCHALDPPG